MVYHSLVGSKYQLSFNLGVDKYFVFFPVTQILLSAKPYSNLRLFISSTGFKDLQVGP